MRNMQEDETASKENSLSLLGWGLLAAFLFYFGLFGLILIDELVLGTHLISSFLFSQPPLSEFLQTIYWPLIQAVRWLLKIL